MRSTALSLVIVIALAGCQRAATQPKTPAPSGQSTLTSASWDTPALGSPRADGTVDVNALDGGEP
jgi:hypothetical protein